MQQPSEHKSTEGIFYGKMQEVFDSDKVNEFANNLRKSLGEDFSIKVN